LIFQIRSFLIAIVQLLMFQNLFSLGIFGGRRWGGVGVVICYWMWGGLSDGRYLQNMHFYRLRGVWWPNHLDLFAKSRRAVYESECDDLSGTRYFRPRLAISILWAWLCLFFGESLFDFAVTGLMFYSTIINRQFAVLGLGIFWSPDTFGTMAFTFSFLLVGLRR